MHLVDRLLHARRDRIRLRDPAEDVDQDYGRIRLDQEFEGLLDLRRIVRAAEVQEDAAPPSLEGQGVERGHRQARAIGDDADVPVQLDEDDALVVRLLLQRRPVLVQIRVLRMAVFRAVVDHELRVARDHAAASRHDEGIDLDELRVLFPEKIVGAAGDGGDLLSDVTLDRKRARQRPKDVRLDPDHRGDVFHEEVLPRDLLHVHPAHRGGHEERLPRGPIDREAEVQFLRDREALLEVHLLHPIPVDVHAEDLARDLARLLQRLRGPDAAGLAASSDEDLRLHHAGKGRVRDLLRLRRHDAAGDRDPVSGEDLLRLVLEELHRGPARR